jgi:hypothetical protein
MLIGEMLLSVSVSVLVLFCFGVPTGSSYILLTLGTSWSRDLASDAIFSFDHGFAHTEDSNTGMSSDGRWIGILSRLFKIESIW